MPTPLETIEKVTGLKRAEMDEIFQQVKANAAKLNACQRHEFSIPIDRRTKQPLAGRSAFCDWECKHCHGRVDFTAKSWYEKGIADAQHELQTKGA